MNDQRFRDREDAGQRLATALFKYRGESPLVLALPRGGVPVGYEVARALGAPLDIWVVRKIGVPWHRELGLGAVSEGGHVYLTPEVVRASGILSGELDRLTQQKWTEVQSRVRHLRGDRPRPQLEGRTVIVVDDGIATGGTMRAALGDIRTQRPRALVLAVPVAAADTIAALAVEVDDAVCLVSPTELYAIGLWYEAFPEVSDAEVTRLLERARSEAGEVRSSWTSVAAPSS